MTAPATSQTMLPDSATQPASQTDTRHQERGHASVRDPIRPAGEAGPSAGRNRRRCSRYRAMIALLSERDGHVCLRESGLYVWQRVTGSLTAILAHIGFAYDGPLSGCVG